MLAPDKLVQPSLIFVGKAFLVDSLPYQKVELAEKAYKGERTSLFCFGINEKEKNIG